MLGYQGELPSFFLLDVWFEYVRKTFDSQLFSLIKKLPSEAKVCFQFSRSEHLFMPMNSLAHFADLDSFSRQGCFLALIVLHTLLLRSAI